MGDSDQVLLRLRSRKDGAWLASPHLRERLVADAMEAGSSLTDMVVKILAARYGLPYEPGKRRGPPGRNQHEIHVVLPAPVDQAVRLAAAGPRRSRADEIKIVLHAYYGLRIPPPPVRARRRPATAAPAT